MSNMKVVLASRGGTKGFLLYPAVRPRNRRGLVALEISKEAFLPRAAPLQGQSSLGLGLPRSHPPSPAHMFYGRALNPLKIGICNGNVPSRLC